MTQFRMGPYLAGTSRPTFVATWDGRTVHVELDSSAIWTLADDATDEALVHMLEQKRARIRAAAERLIEGGFATEIDGIVTVTVSGIDF